MFYNGVIVVNQVVMLNVMSWLFILNNISSNGIFVFIKLGFNESLIVLNLISSSIYTYLILLWVIFYLYTNYKCNSTYSNNIDILVLLIIFYYFFSMFIITNAVSASFKTISVNTNLQNGLVNIHPFYIYILYGWLFIFYMTKYSILNIYTVTEWTTSKFTNYTKIILVGILLGAWWAAQEFNWGGYWSWDPVELLSLFIFIIMLALTHTRYKNLYCINILYIFSAAFIIYCIMRLGVVNTIHSFVRSTSIPYYTFLIISLVLAQLVLITYNQRILDLTISHARLLFYTFIFSVIIIVIVLINLINVNLNIFTIPICSNIDKLFTDIILVYTVYSLICARKFTMLSAKYIYTFIIITLLYLNIVNLLFIVIFMVILLNFISTTFKSFHTILFWLYSLFLSFFIQITIYSIDVIFLDFWVNMNYFSTNKSTSKFYEIFFFEMKKMHIYDIKSLIQHIFGFSVLTNNNTTLFLYSKSQAYQNMFGEEFLFVFLILSLILCLFNYIVNTCVKIKHY